MSGISRKLMGTTDVGGAALAIEDVFSTYLYAGNGTAQVIRNGINLGQSFGSGSANFDGNDKLTIASNVALNPSSGEFTFEAWVNPSVWPANYSTILATDATDGLYIGANIAGQFVVRRLNVGDIIAYGGLPSVGSWTHVAVTRSGSTIRLFFNGVEVSNATSSHTFVQGDVSIADDAGSGAPFTGYISNLRLIKGTALYTANFTPPTSELTAVTNTSLLTCQGADPFVDNSPNAFTITQNGNPTAATFGPFDAAEAGEGGLTWIKQRTSLQSHYLFDTERGAGFGLRTNSTAAEFNYTMYNYNFNSDGFSFVTSDGALNGVGDTYTSWTFRKAPRFFDVVTYTGDGTSNRQISHNLGCDVGSIIVKRVSATDDWYVWHRGNLDRYLRLNTLDNGFAYANFMNPTSTTFTLQNDATNASGATYVAYLYAHDSLGPSGDGSDGLIACGSYTGTGSGKVSIDLGWEPQWVLVKTSSGTAKNWWIIDNMRGAVTGGNDNILAANLSDAEIQEENLELTATGFDAVNTVQSNISGTEYIYIAIRRGPMRQPESGAEVFAIDTAGATAPSPPLWTSGFVTDFALHRTINTANSTRAVSRLTGEGEMFTNLTNAEGTDVDLHWDYMSGFWNGSSVNSNQYAWMFKRAPGFFDAVAYTGDGVAGRTVPHNLGVAPELMIVKSRTSGATTPEWSVYHKDLGNDKRLVLNTTAAVSGSSATFWYNTTPTETQFYTGSVYVNQSGYNYIAYLFASLAGVSKIGSYNGDGTANRVIDCGFTSGARFVMIKAYNTAGDWMIFDTVRGIVTGNDSLLRLNSTTLEVTGFDIIEPAASGFAVTQDGSVPTNESGQSYIFLAIA